AIIQFTVVHLSRQVPTTKAFPLLPPDTQDESTLKAQENKPTESIPDSQQPKPEIKQITLLKSLLDPKQLQVSNHVFVKGLLSAEGGFWVPTDDEELNPIRHAIDIGQRPLIEAFMDYGVKYAKTHHPSYLLPVVRCMKELSEEYPDLVESMFKKSSYVPALNHGYINSHIIVVDPLYRAWSKSLLKFCFPGRGLKKSNNLDGHHKPVFSLRSQLPFRTKTLIPGIPILPSGRISKFLATVDDETKRSRSKFKHKVYVCPYPKLSEFKARSCWHGRRKSAFTMIAEKALFDNPAMRATLSFKWSPYNYMDLITYITCVTGCIMFLNEKPPVDGVDSGPHQVEALSFSILALYLNLLFELRIFKQLGIVVNIIFNIAQKIIWFLMILGFFMCSFTLALQHLLHTRQYRPECIFKDSNATATTDTTCDLKDYPGDYPTGVIAALTDTYFFLVGRYEPVGNSLDEGSTSFRIMMMIFLMFTAILLLNILIALMNDAYDHSKSQGEMALLKQLSGVISEVERFWMIKRDREKSDYFPDYIYYYAPEQDAEIYESKDQITDKSNLSLENKFLMDAITEKYDKLLAAHDAMRKEFEKNQEAQSRPNPEVYPAVGVKSDQSNGNINPTTGLELGHLTTSGRSHSTDLRMTMATTPALNDLNRDSLHAQSSTVEYTIESARIGELGQDTIDGKNAD
ncbi:hypothetical protein BGX27_003173, partial [Mortierella sp. AM989]